MFTSRARYACSRTPRDAQNASRAADVSSSRSGEAYFPAWRSTSRSKCEPPTRTPTSSASAASAASSAADADARIRAARRGRRDRARAKDVDAEAPLTARDAQSGVADEVIARAALKTR